MSLESYLRRHFVDKAAFAELAGLSTQRLDALIDAEAIPDASYICDGRAIRSAVFGAIETDEPLHGEYFRPECVRWAKLAAQAPAGLERSEVQSALTHELVIALERLGLASETVQTMTQNYLPHFWNGTFGLCVADPSTGDGIVRKEILQEKLAALTDNGRNHSPADISRTELLQLIDDFAIAAMPFSPAEYARSSRKRLVDDLRPLVAKV